MGIVKQEYKKYIGINPYIGFVSFMKDNAMCSMEFFYIALNDILTHNNCYDWQKLENNLNIIYKRKHKAIFRVYLDYPTLESGVPKFLQKNIKMIKYQEFGGGVSPDYHSEVLIETLLNFIKELGLKYDGDKRIAFIEMGLIGHWGEWHTYPKQFLMPDKKEQFLIIEAYNKYFNKTKILCRYPDDRLYQKYNIGFHDDSFCFATLATKKHHFMYLMRKNKLDNKWQNNPIGGEVRPEEQEALIQGNKVTENYFKCVKKTHASWLINDKAFLLNTNKDLICQLSSVLGYDFYIDNIKLEKNKLSFNINNKGVAPLYYKFNCYLIIGNRKKLLNYDMRKLEPKQKYTFNFRLNNNDLLNNIYFLITNNEDVIHLSNKYVENDWVLIYKKN